MISVKSRSIFWYVLPLLILTAFNSYGQAETYYVVHVKGEVKDVSSQKLLKVGDALKGVDKISFNPEKSSAILMSTQKGRFSLGKPAKSTLTSTGEFIAFLKNTLVPTTSAGNLSTRGTLTPACANNLKTVLGTETFIFPDDRAVFCIDQHTYPMNENHFFIYRSHHDNKLVNLLISFAGDSLIFEKEILHDDAQEGNPKAEIYYYDKQKNSSIKITSIHPVYINADELKAESEFLIQFYNKQKFTQPEILELLLTHVQETYKGRTDVHMLERWLREHKLL